MSKVILAEVGHEAPFLGIEKLKKSVEQAMSKRRKVTDQPYYQNVREVETSLSMDVFNMIRK